MRSAKWADEDTGACALCCANCSFMFKGFEGGVSAMSPTLPTMPVITGLKQCAVTSSSFTWGAAYQDLLSRTITGIMKLFQRTNVHWFPNDRCWNVYESILQVIFLPIRVGRLSGFSDSNLAHYLPFLDTTQCLRGAVWQTADKGGENPHISTRSA